MSHVIEFIVFPGALGLDITGPLEVFNTANAIIEKERKGMAGYLTRFVSSETGPVRLSSGLEIIATTDFTDMAPVDTLLVPGGSDVDCVINNSNFMDYIRLRSRQVKRIVSVCKGSFILAAAGILDGKSATTHWSAAGELSKRYPQVSVKSDAIFIRDDNVYTSAGVTTGIDLALVIVEEDLGITIALEVARLLILYFRRPGSQSQFSSPLQAQVVAGNRFSSLHNYLVSNLRKEISVAEMAEFSAMSERNFARVFKLETGITPNKYLEILRLDKAREIIEVGREPLDRIAEMSGFGREERLRRAFLRKFLVTPSQYRLHFCNQDRKIK